MSIETRPGFILNLSKREMRYARVDDKGDEVVGYTVKILNNDEDPLVKYDCSHPVSPPCGGDSFDEAAGDIFGIETEDGDVFVANYDAKNPPKYPDVNCDLS